MMNPLDALSAMTKVASPLTQMNGTPAIPNMTNIPGMAGISSFSSIPGMSGVPNVPSIPGVTTGPVNAITENFNLLQPREVPAITSPSVGSNGSPNTWGHMVQQMVMDVNSKQQSATAAVNDVLQGGPTPVHEAMVASEEASLSFQLVAQMRNKVVDAYQQIMQMQV
jgi:flagellar hook-basal body complex protein FliE